MRNSAVLPIVLLLAGCAGEEAPHTATTEAVPAATSAAAPRAAASGPCLGVTDADITEVMGHGMKAGQPTNASECLFVSATGDTTKSVAFQIVPGEATFNQMSTGAEAVDGVGDKAVILGPNTVAAMKGGKTFFGGVYDGTDPSGAKQKSIELAKKVVARM